jgi:tetratricopeptide (TPR) repeat protein
MRAHPKSKTLATTLFAGTLGALAMCVATVRADARSPERKPESEVSAKTLLGGYLSGRAARSQNDTTAAASFYTGALSRDPGNEQLIEKSFDMEATEGNWDRAIPLAQQLATIQPNHRMARMFLSLVEFKRGNLELAEGHIKAANANPIGELTSIIVRAWLAHAGGRSNEGLDLLDAPKMPEWAQAFLRYHRALLADVAGLRSDARAAYDRIFKIEQRRIRTALAYGQHALNAGDTALAKSVLQRHIERTKSDGHPMIKALRRQADAAERTVLLVSNPSEGIAELFYELGEVLNAEGGIGPGAMFIQFALYLQPQFPFALATLANVNEATKRNEKAIAIYDRIPKGTPLETSIEIRKAINLNILDRVDEAKALLEGVAQKNPQELAPLDALGAIMRGHKRYEEAIGYYSRAINLIKKADARHWSYYYHRGTCYERSKRWPQAENDLQTALKLSPDQPLALNYLGYSWVDQNKNLKQGMALIEKAVKLKPDDGYIVDSLGWAHYRQNNFKEAVRYLERAVELRPEDPVLNDHLGDAYWRIGREREAKFQWEQALTLKPEPEDGEKIRKKVSAGLPAQVSTPPPRTSRQVQRVDPLKKRSESREQPSPTLQ